MIIATVSGPLGEDRLLDLVEQVAGQARASSAPSRRPRNAFVLETWRVGIAGGPNGSLKVATPVSESAPSVTPW